MKWTIGIALLVLVGAVALQQVRFRDVKEGDRAAERRPVSLATRVPEALPGGWQGRNEPLGATEVVRSAVEQILNYDDVVYRVFTRGEVTLGVYVAYWAPGRMPIQKVASHTPDRCWTENGWHCVEMEYPAKITTAEMNLRSAQWRLFEPPGQTSHREYVYFWHLVGKELYDYGNRLNATPRITDWWRDTMRYAFSGSDEQYFIRVTSNRDFKNLQGDPGWEALVKSLGGLGLAAPSGS